MPDTNVRIRSLLPARAPKPTATTQLFSANAQGTQMVSQMHRITPNRRTRGTMRTLLWNLSYGIRAMRKNRGLTAAVIATLTLGIGATTAIYTVVYATLVAPLPYPDPNQLVIVWSKVNGHNNGISAG